MKEQFKELIFKTKTLDLINKANRVIKPMMDDGYIMTLRQLYYIFVKNNWLENKKENYDRLGYMIDNGRIAGLIDWNAIEDRTRHIQAIRNYLGPVDFLQSVTERFYAENLWRGQEHYVEVWVEKEALAGVIERPCLSLRVPFLSCRGYPSTTELYLAGKRFASHAKAGRKGVVLYFGDHDPSGIHMPISNAEKLEMFMRGWDIEFHRIALNMDQIEEYDPPANYAKDTDSRFGAYVDEFGTDCWELDALEPRVLDSLVRDNILKYLDKELFDTLHSYEEDNKADLLRAGENFNRVQKYLMVRDEIVNEYDIDIGDNVDNIIDHIHYRIINGD